MDYQDREWIRETLAGNTRSFDKIVIRYQEQIYNLILKTIRNRVDAEDLTQNVFFNAFSNLKKFRKESSLSTWLYSIAINQIRNYWRKKKYKPDYAESDIKLPVEGELLDLYNNIGREMTSEETKQIVDNLISFLPPQQKEIFILYYLIGHSCEEISKILNKSPANIKIQLFRGRKQLLSKFKNISE